MCKALGWVGVGVKPIRACLCLSWDVDIPGNFVTTIPTLETRASGMGVCSVVAIYMGIEDPFLGSTTKGPVFWDRDSNGGPLFRTAGTFGG